MSLPSHSGLYRVIDNYYYACNKEYSHNKGGGDVIRAGSKLVYTLGGGGAELKSTTVQVHPITQLDVAGFQCPLILVLTLALSQLI